jgi:protein-tyrosine phosphatase
MNNILTVCVSNICRSPVAGMLKTACPAAKVLVNRPAQAVVGHGAEATASEIAMEHGWTQ